MPEGIPTATVRHIVEKFPGPAVVHLGSPWGAAQIELDDRSDKQLFKPGQEYYMKPQGARTEEEEQEQAKRLIDHLREVGRLREVSDAALVSEVLDSVAADDLAVAEMMKRLVPKWYENDGRLEELMAKAAKHWSQNGLYDKYRVQKRSGKRVDPDAEYFVMRLDKDPHARRAALAYADSVESENEVLAADLREKAGLVDAVAHEDAEQAEVRR